VNDVHCILKNVSKSATARRSRLDTSRNTASKSFSLSPNLEYQARPGCNTLPQRFPTRWPRQSWALTAKRVERRHLRRGGSVVIPSSNPKGPYSRRNRPVNSARTHPRPTPAFPTLTTTRTTEIFNCTLDRSWTPHCPRTTKSARSGPGNCTTHCSTARISIRRLARRLGRFWYVRVLETSSSALGRVQRVRY
jgi:hypothetical protein